MLVVGIFLVVQKASSQDLEPRFLTNLPVKTNFALFSYSFFKGNSLLDPAIQVEDLDANIHGLIGAYVRSIKIFGLSGKADVVVPFFLADWEGTHEGVSRSRSYTGVGDLRFRLAVNFLGAPALDRENFRDYSPDLISGLSLQLVVPTGQYDNEKLINAGMNRFMIKPQWGISKYWTSWITELYLNAKIFTPNTDLLVGNELTQDPIFNIKVHVIRTFNRKWWLAFDSGYAFGGQTYLNGNRADSRISTLRFGLTGAYPFSQRSTLRLTALASVRFEQGPDHNGAALTYQYRW